MWNEVGKGGIIISITFNYVFLDKHFVPIFVILTSAMTVNRVVTERDTCSLWVT